MRIRYRYVSRLLPTAAAAVLDAGCGRGVITRMLARRFPDAVVEGLDANEAGQFANQALAERIGLSNCHFTAGDLTRLDRHQQFDLIVSVDNLEHIEDDQDVLRRFRQALKPGGTLLVHVPHYYRRWPVFAWRPNFDVPGHVRRGYHQAELLERLGRAGFMIAESGFSFGVLENLANNIGYLITRAEERNKMIYAIAFPLLNALAWLGHAEKPKYGAGLWARASVID